jgi:hypothetical protein
MTAEWSLPAWAALTALAALGVLAVVLLLALVVVRRAGAGAAATAASAAAEARAAREAAEHLAARLLAVEQRHGDASPAPAGGAATAPERGYVITRLGEEPSDRTDDRADERSAPVVDGPLFADLVLREGVVQAASFAAGLRRALAPEHLNRVRFEMRRELKRARKQRRADLRQAKREHDARQRADGEFAA